MSQATLAEPLIALEIQLPESVYFRLRAYVEKNISLDQDTAVLQAVTSLLSK